jgi:ABC-type glycerol-3-phosphate transport system permease component
MKNLTATHFGAITGLILGVGMLIIKLLQLESIKGLEIGIFAIPIIGVISSCMYFAKRNNYQINFGTTFGNGFRTTAMAGLLTLGITMLSYLVLPNLKTQKLQNTKANWIEQATAMKKDLVVELPNIDKGIAEQSAHFYSLESSRIIFPILVIGALFSALAAFGLSRVKLKD